MAFRYRERTAEDGDVLDPKDWNLNMAAFAEEFNGRMDRDNLPASAVTVDHIVYGACGSAANDVLAAPVALSNDTVTWQTVQEDTITVETDALVEAEWGGYWEWAASGGTDAIGYRLLVNGIEVARAPLLSPGTTATGKSSVHIFGDIGLPPATHTVTLQARLFDADDDLTETTPATGTVTVQLGEMITSVFKR